MIIRIQLINGDSRQGLYVRRDDTHVTINDGRDRKIPFRMIADVSEPPRQEACLESE